MIHLPSTAEAAAARKRGSQKLAAVNRKTALEVRYGMRDHYPGWGKRTRKVGGKRA